MSNFSRPPAHGEVGEVVLAVNTAIPGRIVEVIAATSNHHTLARVRWLQPQMGTGEEADPHITTKATDQLANWEETIEYHLRMAEGMTTALEALHTFEAE